MLVSGVQQSDSVVYIIYMCIYIYHIYVLFQIFFSYRLLQHIEYSSQEAGFLKRQVVLKLEIANLN